MWNVCILDRRVAHMEENWGKSRLGVCLCIAACVLVFVSAAGLQVCNRTVTPCQQGAVQEQQTLLTPTDGNSQI